MFENVAEEIANKRCHEIMCYGHCSFSSPKHHRCGEWHREYNCALAGLKAGFETCAKARLNVTTISDSPIRDDQLTKAKEIINNLIELVEFLNEDNVKEPVIAEAEQFIKECK